MTNNDKQIINEYKNDIIKTIPNSSEITMSINKVDDINNYIKEAKEELEKLEELSLEYKLYDKHYKEFRLAMGKVAIGLSKLHKIKVEDKEKTKLVKVFINIHDEFEELMQRNIMKDAYVWK